MCAKRENQWRALGQSIAAAQDIYRSTRSIHHRSGDVARFLEEVERGEKEKGQDRRPWTWAVVSAAAAACALFVVLWVNPEPAQFTVDSQTGRVGVPIRASHRTSVPIDFSDGSQVWLEPEAVARVQKLAKRGASISLEQGQAYVRVVHRPKTRWQISAGPYRVRVTGTSFHISWSSEKQELGIDMDEGSVLVDGPHLKAPRKIVAGESVHLTPIEQSEDVDDDSNGDDLTSGETETPGNRRKKSRRQPRRRTVRPSSPGVAIEEPVPSTAPLSWSELADQRKYREAFEKAEELGFDALCQELDAVPLLKLADVARFAGRPNKAAGALLALRGRFTGSIHAATSAYILGRISFKRRGQDARAERWFTTYLREAPAGPLAGEALGRLMEVQHRQGLNVQARESARRYLRQFPSGAHGALARRLMSE